MDLQLDTGRTREVGQRLLAAWNAGGIFDDSSMPEDPLPAGMARGSSEHALFLTLTVAIDYMRNADQLWEAARAAYVDPETRYLFDPGAVVRAGVEKCQRDLTHHHVVKKQNKDTVVWTTICGTLAQRFDGRVESLLAAAGWRGPEVIDLIRDPEYQGGFPNLKGAKIAPLWVRMLKDNWQGHPLEQMELVPLPVDVHTSAATVMTGCVTGSFHGRFPELARAVQRVWRDACAGGEHYPLQFDEPLWHLSRNGCRKTVCMPCEFEESCPVGSYCTRTRLSAYGSSGQVPAEVAFDVGVW